MPDFPIIDSHIHIIDHRALPYGWVAQLPEALRASRSVDEFRSATAGLGVARAVMVEFLVHHGHERDEARYAQGLVQSSPPLSAFVASAPVEQGAAVERDLKGLAAIPAVRAIRRVPAGGNYAVVLGTDFVEGVRAVGKAGWPFEIGVHHASLFAALELVRRCPEVTFVLDHLGTPPISGSPEPGWHGLMKEFGALHNVRAKLSGLMAGTSAGWQVGDVVAHLRVAIECFGVSRVMYGSDWPMFTPVIAYADWVRIVEQAATDLTPDESREVFAGVAARTYRLEGMADGASD